MQLTEFAMLQNNTRPCNYSKAAFTSLLALCLDSQFLETFLKYRNTFAAWALAFYFQYCLPRNWKVLVLLISIAFASKELRNTVEVMIVILPFIVIFSIIHEKQ